MNTAEFTNPATLEKYAFWWSEARLVIAAIALLLGGIPPVLLLAPGLFAVTVPLLKICWLVTGAVSLYLAYRFYQTKTVFGGNNTWDLVAFAILVVTGINLGWTGLTGNNVGMSIAGGRVIFLIAGLIYLAVAAYIFRRHKAYGRIF